VAYLDYKKTHWLNVNQWLVERGYAAYVDYPNKFHPTWLLYVPKAATPNTADGVAPATVAQTAPSTVTATQGTTTNTVKEFSFSYILTFCS